MDTNNLQWGWRPHGDKRTLGYPMTLDLYDGIELDLPSSIMWSLGPILDQGQTTHCVGYAWKQWQQSTPLQTLDGPSADEIFAQCAILDGDPNEDGSTTQTGVKAMGREGRIQTYLWEFSLGVFKQWILGRGPIVVGTCWYEAMFEPDADHYVHPVGPDAGGHEYMCYGYQASTDSFKFVNSWGTDWGDKGTFWMKSADVNKLIWHDSNLHGDACAAVEKKLTPITPGTATH